MLYAGELRNILTNQLNSNILVIQWLNGNILVLALDN